MPDASYPVPEVLEMPTVENPQNPDSDIALESVSSHGGGGGHHHPPELENFWNLLARTPLNNESAVTHHVIKHFDPYVDDPNAAKLNLLTQNVFFSILSVFIIIGLFRFSLRKRALIPDRVQGMVEMLISGLNDFFIGILGAKHGPRYIPFLVALFVFIFVNNVMGMIPLMKASTSAFQCNIALGICVFAYVQYTGLRYSGPRRYLLHLMGNPSNAVTWILAPFFLVLEIISEIVKPISLALRVFGNVLGEDILIGTFAMLGISLMAMLLKPVGVEHPLIGIPLQLPFMFIVLLASTIQALIFSLLSCVYIMMMLPHDEGH